MKLPQRKHPRLKEYDYSTAGSYFITLCTQNRRCIFLSAVGRGLAPAAYTVCGKIAEQQLLLLPKRYPSLSVDQYIIMPNHIHMILTLNQETAGASPRPTVMDIVCAYKSLTTRECKKSGWSGSPFQASFYEHIIRGEKDYAEIAAYISENPMRWECDELYEEE